MDFSAHNQEVKKVWEAYNSGDPYRVPMRIGANPRIYLLNKELNKENISFEKYINDVDTMIEVQLKFQNYVRHNIIADHEMGLPYNDGWFVWPDMQNFYEAAWYGAKIVFCEDNCPTTKEILNNDNKNMLFEKGIPDAFGGGYIKALEQYEYMKTQVGRKGYKGVEIGSVGLPSYYSDGPFTVACNLRGATQLCYDIFEDPDYVEQLLDFITDATIYRIKTWNKRFLGKETTPTYFFADDSLQLLSLDTYKDLVLPRHRRIVAALSDGVNHIHLCGNTSRFYPLMRDELNIRSFETGFPIDHGEIVRELGPDVEVLGGPHIDLLLSGTPEAVREETKKILLDIKPHKKFILRDANNLCPNTPPENIKAMYDAVKEFGKY